jgi:hypothetical protein
VIAFPLLRWRCISFIYQKRSMHGMFHDNDDEEDEDEDDGEEI